jgi:hypothetical protein
VQAHSVAIFVYQFDAVDSACAARCAADFVHQFEQDSGTYFPRYAQMRLYPEMQHGEALVRRAHEDGNAYRPSYVGYREQSLHPCDIAHTDAQAAVLLKDLRHSIGFNGLLDAETHAMLVDVEEQQLFQRGTLVELQF